MTRSRIAIVAFVLVLGACSSSSKSSSSVTSSPTTTVAPSSGGTGTTVAPSSGGPTTTNARSALASVGPATATGKSLSLAKSTQGIFLIGPQGHALYIFSKDTGTTSACTSSGCVQTWSAFTATGSLSFGTGINQAEVSTAHGQVANQVTYYGHLLYYFSGDSAPGDTNGVGIPDWFLIGPFGNQMLPR
jgi:predicted lipoprotein with Yx(FWY)xxD motif